MYGRDYGGKTLQFEASGGLTNSSLVMQDKQTDSYWSIMTGTAIGGVMKGTALEEMPVSEKMQWKDWVEKHPDTVVLSVGGFEDVPFDPYADYFASSAGFRSQRATDPRLPTKAPIFAFHLGGKAYAAAHRGLEGGKVSTVGGAELFFYRAAGSPIFASTVGFASGTYMRKNSSWIETRSGCRFDPAAGAFKGTNCPQRISGFDTFWYNWSLNNPGSRLLK